MRSDFNRMNDGSKASVSINTLITSPPSLLQRQIVRQSHPTRRSHRDYCRSRGSQSNVVLLLGDGIAVLAQPPVDGMALHTGGATRAGLRWSSDSANPRMKEPCIGRIC